MQTRTTILIDPRNLSAQSLINNQAYEHSVLLEQLLKKYIKKQGLVFEQPHLYPLEIINKDNTKHRINVMLTESIIYRATNHGDRYETKLLKQPKLGKGGFGSVTTSIRTLAPKRNGGLIAKNNKNRVIKYIKFNKDKYQSLNDFKAEVENEVQLSQRLSHLHSKQLTYRRNKHGKIVGCYIVMRKMSGKSLEEILKDNLLTDDQRLQLCINIFRALQEQIHDRNILHLDIKPENIFVNPKTLEVSIIDVGLSVDFNKEVKIACGSIDYMATELFNKKPATIKTDLFCVGVTIGEIWKATNERKLCKTPVTIYLKHKQLNVIRDMFPQTYVSSLSPLHQKAIIDLLTNLTDHDPNKRFSIADSLEILETIKLLRNSKKFNKEEKIRAHEAYLAARETYEALRKVKLEHKKFTIELNSAKNKGNTFNKKTLNYDPLKAMVTTINNSLGQINDSEIAVKQFIDTLSINELKGLKDKKSIITKTNMIINQFKSNMLTLLDLLEKAERDFSVIAVHPKYDTLKNTLQALLLDINILFNKENKIELTLDNLADLNKRLKPKVKKIKNEITVFQSTLLKDNSTKLFNEYRILLDQLNNLSTEADPFIQLKNKIKSAIYTYFTSTFAAGVKTQEHAASPKRLKDMQDLVAIVEKANDQESLVTDINDRLNRIETGFFGFFGRSKLKKGIKNIAEIKEAPKLKVC